MPVFTEGRHAAEFIMHEQENTYCREAITIGASQSIVAGTVLGKVTATSAHVVLAPAAEDGSEDVAGIAIYPATTGVGSSAEIAGLVRGPAIVNGNLLTWPAGITTPQMTAALTQLEALGILVR